MRNKLKVHHLRLWVIIILLFLLLKNNNVSCNNIIEETLTQMFQQQIYEGLITLSKQKDFISKYSISPRGSSIIYFLYSFNSIYIKNFIGSLFLQELLNNNSFLTIEEITNHITTLFFDDLDRKQKTLHKTIIFFCKDIIILRCSKYNAFRSYITFKIYGRIRLNR